MPNTTFYQLPYPAAGSTVDVPRDIKALADKLELWKNGLTIPSGDAVLGDSAVTTGRFLRIRRLVGGTAYEASISCGGATVILGTYLAGAAQASFALNQNGQLTTYTADNTPRPLPFAMQGGSDAYPIIASTSSARTITYTSGRFTKDPLIFTFPDTGSGTHIQMYQHRVHTTSLTGFTAVANSTVNFTVACPFYWLAIQMTLAGAPGRAAREPYDAPLRTVVCRTAGCDNESVPIDVFVPEESGGVSCGPCGQPIDEVGKAKKAKG